MSTLFGLNTVILCISFQLLHFFLHHQYVGEINHIVLIMSLAVDILKLNSTLFIKHTKEKATKQSAVHIHTKIKTKLSNILNIKQLKQ